MEGFIQLISYLIIIIIIISRTKLLKHKKIPNYHNLPSGTFTRNHIKKKQLYFIFHHYHRICFPLDEEFMMIAICSLIIEQRWDMTSFSNSFQILQAQQWPISGMFARNGDCGPRAAADWHAYAQISLRFLFQLALSEPVKAPLHRLWLSSCCFRVA